MDFTDRYDGNRHEYSAYGKINKLLIPLLYKHMCDDLPYYTVKDSEYNLRESTLENRVLDIYSHYYPYKGYATIDARIMCWYNGHLFKIFNHSKTLFHKNLDRLNKIYKKKDGYIVKTITLKRMVPLLGKVKDVPYFKPTLGV